MSNQPVIFNIQYTPYSLPKSATAAEREQHAGERAFFDMTGKTNVYEYITTEGKQTGGKRTALEYLQKNTGVFNDKGMIGQTQVDEMKARLKKNKGHIWHGFISLNKEESYKIDTPEKCIELIKRTFPSFIEDLKLDKNNVDLMCALHLDRPEHLHIHFVFWEKEPKFKGKDGDVQYRRRGKIDKKAIDNMFVRLGLYLDDGKSKLYKARDKSLKMLRDRTKVKVAMSDKEIQKEIIALAKDLPKKGRLSYGSKDMEPYRERVDRIVQMLLNSDGRARAADNKFFEALTRRENAVKNICTKQTFCFSNKNVSAEHIEGNLPTYHNEIDEKNIHLIDDLKYDYKRRQGNLVINLAKFIKPEFYEGKKRKPNDKAYKTMLGISKRIVNRACKRFFSSFGQESEMLERDFTHRLQDIEEEMERERNKQEKKQREEDYKNLNG